MPVISVWQGKIMGQPESRDISAQPTGSTLSVLVSMIFQTAVVSEMVDFVETSAEFA